MSRKVPFLVSLALLAASCEIPFELDSVSEPALYVHYIVEAGASNGFVVAYAEPSFGTLSGQQYPFSPSDVTLTVGGKTASLSEDPDASSWNSHVLSAGGVPSPGSEVRLQVKGRGCPDVLAVTTVPEPPVIKSVDISLVEVDSSTVNRISIRLDRPAGRNEHYALMAVRRVTTIYETTMTLPGMPDSVQTDTVVYQNGFSPGYVASLADINSLDLDDYLSVGYSGGFISATPMGTGVMTLLSAERFSSDTYTFYADAFDSSLYYDFIAGYDASEEYTGGEEYGQDDGTAGDGSYDGDGLWPDDGWPDDGWPGVTTEMTTSVEYRFSLYRLSDEFYNYAKAQYLSRFDMLANFGVSPPNFTYTNVSGGLGVVAGIAAASTDWIPGPQE